MKEEEKLVLWLEDYENDIGGNRAIKWQVQAGKNLEKWGVQTHEELLLAIQEELGELTQAYLEHNYEGADKKRISEELDDLAALIFQLDFKIYLEERGAEE